MKIFGVKDPEFLEKVLKLHREIMEKMTPIWPSAAPRLDDIELEISNRLAVCAGKARYLLPNSEGEFQKFRVILNYRLLKENPHEIGPTYIHELMHILAGILYPRVKVGHGYMWQNLMIQAGVSAERCHSMDVSNYRRARKRHVYRCEKCENKHYFLTQQKHLRQQTRDCYRCRCNGHLQYMEKVVNV